MIVKMEEGERTVAEEVSNSVGQSAKAATAKPSLGQAVNL
jgi:hypothetical protein